MASPTRPTDAPPPSEVAQAVHLLEPLTGALPEGYSGTLVVALNQDGNLFFRNVAVTLNDLPRELEHAAAGRTNLLLVLQADRRANQESITRVAAIARAVGVHKTWLATQPGLLEKKEKTQ